MSRGLELRLRKLERKAPPAHDYSHLTDEELEAELDLFLSQLVAVLTPNSPAYDRLAGRRWVELSALEQHELQDALRGSIASDRPPDN